jgi:hypothetical protein
MMEAVGSSETSVNMYQTTGDHTPDDSILHGLRVFQKRMLGRNLNIRASNIRENCTMRSFSYTPRRIVRLLISRRMR